MEIIRANNSGFCFGVKKAIEKTENEINKKGEPNKAFDKHAIYTVGQLIHNMQVIESLEAQGVKVIDSIKEAGEGDTVIVRSHGEPKSFYNAADDREVNIVDATCPFVSRIHELVEEAFKENKKIIIVGDKSHQEVIATNGWCGNQATIINSVEEAKEIKRGDFFLVCQTTIRRELLDDIVEVLTANGVKLTVRNTICSATRLRQESCKELSKIVDAMVVIGGKNSSNTKKLYEIAQKNCKHSYFVQNINNLPLKELQKYNRIGVAAGASTPESIIEEVIANMSETIEKNNVVESTDESMADFMDEIDASLRLPRNGEVVDGTVHQVTEKEVIVNLGCKKDGILPVEEVTLEEGKTLTDEFKPGDEVQAKVVKTDDGDGSILLSKKKLEISKHWADINEAHESKAVLNVKVIRAVNGGVIAAYKEVTGFIPMSQLSDRYVESAEEFIGKSFDIRVTRVDPRRNRAVFSHKSVLMEQKQQQIAEIWEKLKVGDIVDGTVMRFTDYGAFVDIGGLDGLLHISEISWGKLKHPQEVLKIGETLKVKVISMNQEKGKISLGLKQITPEPWSVIGDKYVVGAIVTGKVVQIKEYGAFVELEPGLDGLVHISEVAHKRVADIADELQLGQQVETKILDIDTERKRISLSIKAAISENGELVEETEPEIEVEIEPEVQEEALAETSNEEVQAEVPSEEVAEETANKEVEVEVSNEEPEIVTEEVEESVKDAEASTEE